MLVHALHSCNSQDWARLKPELAASSRSPTCVQRHKYLDCLPLCPQHINRKLYSVLEHPEHEPVPVWDPGIAGGGGLMCCITKLILEWSFLKSMLGVRGCGAAVLLVGRSLFKTSYVLLYLGNFLPFFWGNDVISSVLSMRPSLCWYFLSLSSLGWDESWTAGTPLRMLHRE